MTWTKILADKVMFEIFVKLLTKSNQMKLTFFFNMITNLPLMELLFWWKTYTLNL